MREWEGRRGRWRPGCATPPRSRIARPRRRAPVVRPGHPAIPSPDASRPRAVRDRPRCRPRIYRHSVGLRPRRRRLPRTTCAARRRPPCGRPTSRPCPSTIDDRRRRAGARCGRAHRASSCPPEARSHASRAPGRAAVPQSEVRAAPPRRRGWPRPRQPSSRAPPGRQARGGRGPRGCALPLHVGAPPDAAENAASHQAAHVVFAVARGEHPRSQLQHLARLPPSQHPVRPIRARCGQVPLTHTVRSSHTPPAMCVTTARCA